MHNFTIPYQFRFSQAEQQCTNYCVLIWEIVQKYKKSYEKSAFGIRKIESEKKGNRRKKRQRTTLPHKNLLYHFFYLSLGNHWVPLPFSHFPNMCVSPQLPWHWPIANCHCRHWDNISDYQQANIIPEIHKRTLDICRTWRQIFGILHFYKLIT